MEYWKSPSYKEGDPFIHEDKVQDVLYIVRADGYIFTSSPTPNDGYLILDFDRDGTTVGARLLDARGMPAAEWKRHPDRHLIPRDLLFGLDEWFDAKETGNV